MTSLYWGLFLAAVFLIGAPTSIGISNVGVLYTTEGFDPAAVAALVSCTGVALMVGKTLYGWLADRLGGRRSTLLLYGMSLLSYVLLCLAPNGSRLCAFAAVLAFGLGLPVSNVSFSIWARDFLGDEGFARGLKWSQTVYALGIVALGPLPGWLADVTGGYVASYGLFLGMMAISFLFIMLVYRRTKSGKGPG
jgi:MFS family permease